MKATHFIEVVKGSFGTFEGSLYEISFLKDALEVTLEIGCTTVAIWKIKFK